MADSITPHILIFPYPAQGHILPLLDLTHQLALRGATITIVVTPKNLPILHPLLSRHPSSIHTLVFPFPTHPSIPPGVENVQHLPIQAFKPMMRVLSRLHRPILRWAQSHPSPPVTIVSDLFLGWTLHLANDLHVPRIVFSPSCALAVSITNSLWRDLPKRDDPSSLVEFTEIPSSPGFPFCQLSTVYRSYVEGDPDSEFIRQGMLANVASWGIVFNSFAELDSAYLEYLKRDLGHDRVWAVGPLSPVDEAPKERGGSSSVDASELLSWLDACPDHSVVYVCFGSQAVLSNRQMEELAKGLEMSEARFVWCVKEPTEGHAEGEYGSVPDGFMERVMDRGVVIKGWAPQVVILSHRAVGAFLTHCGWNSVLEAVAAGVPMLTWPMGADQFPNAALLVDRMGVAVRVCEGAVTVPEAEELARAVAESVSEKAELKRKRAAELRDAAVGAVREGGSSFWDLDRLFKELRQLSAVEPIDGEKKA